MTEMVISKIRKGLARKDGQWQVCTTLYEPGSFVPLLRIDQHNLTSDPILLELKRQLADAGEPLPDELRDALSEDAGDCRYASYHTDHLGTPLALTDEHGHTLWEASPDDWAAVSNEQGNTDQPLRFQGQYEDEESGLYYNRHRYYDPQLGRYVNQDPIGLRSGESNFYNYPRNPIQGVDPLGLYEDPRIAMAQRAAGLDPNRQDLATNAIRSFSKSLYDRVMEGINFGGKAGGMLVVGVGAKQDIGVAINTDGKVCVTNTTCLVVGPMVGGTTHAGGSVATGSVNSGSSTWGVGLTGQITPGLGSGISGEINLDGSTELSAEGTMGGAIGAGLLVCKKRISEVCN